MNENNKIILTLCIFSFVLGLITGFVVKTVIADLKWANIDKRERTISMKDEDLTAPCEFDEAFRRIDIKEDQRSMRNRMIRRKVI